MANSSDPSDPPESFALEFHYDLERKNRETVRKQAEIINKNLKKIKASVSGRRDEPTEQFVTKPSVEETSTCLQDAIEEVRKSLPPPTEDTSLPILAKKKRRWFSWTD